MFKIVMFYEVLGKYKGVAKQCSFGKEVDF